MDEDASYLISVTKRCSAPRGIRTHLENAVRQTLATHAITRSQVNITLVDDEEMAELNERHLNHTGPTDVLTFDLSENSKQLIEGEIVVSVDTAARESADRKHSLSEELTLYVIHGTLHLLGYDDSTTRQAARMHRMEDEILTQLGLRPVYSGGGAEGRKKKPATPSQSLKRKSPRAYAKAGTRSKV